MDEIAQKTAIGTIYQGRFGAAPDVMAFAPGRVNLLGEHTDYNDGFVLPMALRDLGVAIAIGQSDKVGQIDIWSETLGQSACRDVTETSPNGWSGYVLGCIRAVSKDQLASCGLNVALATSVPLGAGLSSSAALEVATLRALSAQFALDLSPLAIAQTAKSVENDFVGLPCGIMDQFASAVGAPGTALFLDTQSMAYESAPGLEGHHFVIIESGVGHRLTDSGYATRVAECQSACTALGVASLREVVDTAQIEALPTPLNLRARHVLTDNQLVRGGLAALRSGDATRFGALMDASHASARDNYEITVPETNAIAATAKAFGALGARQTGGGWGGAVVALVAESQVDIFSAQMTERFENARILAVT